MSSNVFKKFYGSALILKQLPLHRKIAYLAPEKIGRMRDARVRDIVRYAATTVPFYQCWFQDNGVDYRDIRTARDLDGLPQISKEMVRDNPTHFVSISRQGKNAIRFVTSGTTGTPLNIYHDVNSLLSNIAYCEPEKEVVRRLIQHRKKARQISINFSGSTIRAIWKVYSGYTFLKPPSMDMVFSIDKSFDDLIDIINTRKPDIINGYGAHLEALFTHALSQRSAKHIPSLLNFGADGMTDTGKQFLKDELGVSVLSRYGAVESFRIGYTCESDEGFHLHDSLCDVKVVGPDGNRLADGEQGEVVISNLVNRGTVLLNYKLGDIATRSTIDCSCGRSQPLLSDLVGRKEDFICRENGEKIHPRLVWNVFKPLTGVLRYQLIQHAYDKFELKIMARNLHDYQQIVLPALAQLQTLLGKVQIDSHYHEQLEVSSNGKFRRVISYCQN